MLQPTAYEFAGLLDPAETLAASTLAADALPPVTLIDGSVVVGVDGRGRIAFVERGSLAAVARQLADRNQFSEFLQLQQARHTSFAHAVTKYSKLVAMPGLVDTHCHGPQYVFTGTGSDLQLLDWLNTYTFPTEARFADESFARLAYERVVRATLSTGTTTCCYFGTVHLPATRAFADIVDRLGQRAFVGKVCMDRNAPPSLTEDTAESLADSRRLVDHVRQSCSARVQPVLTPRFVPTCSTALLDGLGQMASDMDVFVQSHISENPAEIKWVAELHPEASSYADVYRRAGLLNARSIMAHAVHLGADEIAMFQETGAAVSHCPNSNFSLRSGVLDVRRLLAAGVKVGLGTDVSGGYSCSMWNAMRHSLLASNVVAMRDRSPALDKPDAYQPLSYKEAFWLATMGGARALGLHESIGRLSVGRAFDALVLDFRAPNSPVPVFPDDSPEALVQKMFFLGDDRNIAATFIDGRLVSGDDSSKTYE